MTYRPVECVLIAAHTPLAGERAARRAGLEPRLVIGKRDCAAPLGNVRRQARKLGLRTVAIHTHDWDREVLPQLFELAALRIGLPDCRILVGDGAVQRRLSRGQLGMHGARLPYDGSVGVTQVGLEALHLSRVRRHRTPSAKLDEHSDGVLAIWPGASSTAVGGAVTHVSGVLAAFRHRGLRIGLLTLGPPPPQLAEIADEIEVVPPLSRALRLTREVALISSNRAVREAGRKLLRRVRPRLVYQRHEAFATYGVELADLARVPLVLEWNNSEVWAYLHWHAASPLKRAFTPLAGAMERYAVERADLIVSVSSHSEQMALEQGASPDRVMVLPNGVDIEAVDRVRRSLAPNGNRGGTLGWVGSFTPWHGADVLVRALARLPDDVTAVLIGDGAERAACQSLARELQVAQRIEFAGALTHPEVVRRLSECELLVSPHVPMPERPFFGSPTKIFEYMAIGRPIVASALEQISEILEDGRTARLVRPGDPEDLARGVSSVLGLPDRGDELGRAARREAETRHTWDARVEAILDRLELGYGAGGADTVEYLQLAGSD